MISVDDVSLARGRLKRDKIESSYGLFSNHCKHAGGDLGLHQPYPLSYIYVHGSIPDDLLRSTTILIPRRHNTNLPVAENYRGITLGSKVDSLFDLIILLRFAELFVSSEH